MVLTNKNCAIDNPVDTRYIPNMYLHEMPRNTDRKSGRDLHSVALDQTCIRNPCNPALLLVITDQSFLFTTCESFATTTRYLACNASNLFLSFSLRTALDSNTLVFV